MTPQRIEFLSSSYLRLSPKGLHLLSIQNHFHRKKFQTTSSDNRWRSEETQLSNPKEFQLHQWETSIHLPLPSLLGERNLTALADVLPQGNHVVSYCTGRPTPVREKVVSTCTGRQGSERIPQIP
ncbi:hypothetical protein NPIL_340031 [Nephila pilipes]|uniref:Uncharacterized protein n=1 Tax=Nephila pilipes TaxID=299642 RepID=A0A8X6PLJ7_NEPPI|nr:hypothetical protein NPIL_340031 [Nephila pilipes]